MSIEFFLFKAFKLNLILNSDQQKNICCQKISSRKLVLAKFFKLNFNVFQNFHYSSSACNHRLKHSTFNSFSYRFFSDWNNKHNFYNGTHCIYVVLMDANRLFSSKTLLKVFPSFPSLTFLQKILSTLRKTSSLFVIRLPWQLHWKGQGLSCFYLSRKVSIHRLFLSNCYEMFIQVSSLFIWKTFFCVIFILFSYWK